LPEGKALPKHASLAASQVALDRQRLGKRPTLLARKWKRMAASAFAFLRGGALLFDECLRREGSWAKGPSGGGSLVGDLHLENFGVFIADGGAAIFHVNDFDALRDGPWRFDVLRLLTSILLARPELGVSGTQAQELARVALDGHQRGLAGKRVAPPALVLGLCREAQQASAQKLLKKHVDGGKLLRDEKHPPAPAKWVKQVPPLLVKWSVSLPGEFGPSPEQLKVLDVRRRISGTGSLGVERLIILVQGDARGHWLLEAKEVDFSAERVVEAMRGAVKKPPALIGYAELGQSQMVIRPLSAGEEKLSLEKLDPDQLPTMIRFLGAMAGQVHRSLARSRLKKWTAKEQHALLASSRRLAAMHEEAFIDFCALHPR
jgi:uncharacterized protein (DUF2252 family)